MSLKNMFLKFEVTIHFFVLYDGHSLWEATGKLDLWKSNLIYLFNIFQWYCFCYARQIIMKPCYALPNKSQVKQ